MDSKEYISIAKELAEVWIRLMVLGEQHLSNVVFAIVGDLIGRLRELLLEEARQKALKRGKPVP